MFFSEATEEGEVEMGKSRLPKGGTNLFQEIKKKCAQVEKQGVKLLKLSIGQPTGPALFSARKAAAKAVMSGQESMHEYQDNGSPGAPNFARDFVQFHTKSPFEDKNVDYMPIPGIKPMLGLVPLACGCANDLTVATTTKPGYPTPRDWCKYLRLRVQEVPLDLNNRFRFLVDDIDEDVKLIMMNYPHNPTGQIATQEWLRKLCMYCVSHNIRIFNDAAYIALSHTSKSCALADVAIDFPELSWAEAYSASKLIGNGTGWRIGAIVGSSDFVGDIKTIKGNTDSGFVAPMAVGVISAVKNSKEALQTIRETYGYRLSLLIGLLSKHGMSLAVTPGAGFFTLWKTPKMAFGKKVENAEHFNFMMIEQTGVVGVHFEPYIRYAVCGDIKTIADEINRAFKKADVSY